MVKGVNVKKNINLDIIRTFAIGMVMSVHVGQIAGFNASVGAKGVQLFFVLSGYLICSSLEKYDLKTYMTRRAWRIIPAYYIALLLNYVWEIILYTRSMSLSEVLSGPLGYKYLRYFGFLQLIIPSENWNLWNNRNGWWTMSTFAIFYLIAPVIYKFFYKFNRAFAALIVMLFLTPFLREGIEYILSPYFSETGQITYFSELNPLCQIYCFLFGMLIYLSCKEKKQVFYVTILLIALTVTSMKWYSYEIIFTVLVMAAAQGQPLIKNERGRKIISYLSQGSYGVYLCHMMYLQMAAVFSEKTGLKNFYYANIVFVYLFVIICSYCTDNMIRKIMKKLQRGNHGEF